MAMVPTAAFASSGGGSSLASGFGSSFLTGAGAALGSALGGSKGKSASYQYRKKRDYARAIEHETQYGIMSGRVAAARELGLHPLAALGISGGGSGGMAIPGQSTSGNAIGEGIKAATQAYGSHLTRQHQSQIADLQLEEQQLRNDWLRSQIAASKLKTLGSVANASQGIPLSSLTDKPSKSTVVQEQPPYEHAGQTTGYSLFGKIPLQQRPGKLVGQGAEDALGDFGNAIYSPFSILQDIGYTLDLMYRNPDGSMKKGTNWYDAPRQKYPSP